MATSSDGQGFKTKDKPAGERPDVCPVPLNAHAPGVGRATPTDQDREKARKLMVILKHPTRQPWEPDTYRENYLAQALADEREAAYRAGQEEMKDRAWREIDIKWGPDASGLIQVLAIEPPPSEGKSSSPEKEGT